ncbi:unnamed protein product [Colias eurytheme]|nr:unnamed protein product [Colias eurytheme]
MWPALRDAKDDTSTREWYLQLMARTQVAFNETDDESSKLYLCDIFALSSIAFSGVWSFEPDTTCIISSREKRYSLLPAGLAVLVGKEGWKECSLQVLEWLCHTRDATRDPHTARACQRSLLALRHCEQFVAHKIWTRLEHHFAPTVTSFED